MYGWSKRNKIVRSTHANSTEQDSSSWFISTLVSSDIIRRSRQGQYFITDSNFSFLRLNGTDGILIHILHEWLNRLTQVRPLCIFYAFKYLSLDRRNGAEVGSEAVPSQWMSDVHPHRLDGIIRRAQVRNSPVRETCSTIRESGQKKWGGLLFSKAHYGLILVLNTAVNQFYFRFQSFVKLKNKCLKRQMQCSDTVDILLCLQNVVVIEINECEARCVIL